MNARHLRLLIIFLIISPSLIAQKTISVQDALKKITKTLGTQFVYDEQIVVDKTTTYDFEDIKKKSTEDVLKAVLYPNNLVFLYVKTGYYAIVSKNRVGLKNNLSLSTTEVQPVSNASTGKTKISGSVTDSLGKAIPNATVTENGSKSYTLTNTDGNFVINVQGTGSVLTFTSVGYLQKQVAVGNQTVLSVSMQQTNASLNDVVVIGYGQQRKADVTSSVATIKSANFVKGPVLDAGQLLQGKVAGLSVSTPSGNPTSGSVILLRGNVTLLGANTSPLIIIDGVPGSLKTVAPEDIESIDVLKDGSSAAIYGVRGSNGVIIITTKRASGNNINSVDYNGYSSTSTIARQPELLTAQDYRNQIAAGTRDKAYDLGANTDWIKAISNNFPISNVHTLTFRGGNSQTNYLASANYRFLDGIFKKSDNSTFTGRVDINHSMFNGKLKLNLGILQSNNSFTQTQDGGSFNGYTFRQALIQNPTAPIKGPDGNYFEQPTNFQYQNPLSMIYNSDGQTSNITGKYNASIIVTPIAGLRLSALGSYTRFNQVAGYSENFHNISTIRDHLNGYAAVGNAQSIDRLLELTAEYSKVIGDHRFSLLGGYSYQDNNSFGSFEQNHNFPTDIFSYNQIQLGQSQAQGLGVLNSSRSNTNLISFFGRATYNYKERYLLLASVRREAASQLYGTNEPYGTFPAVQVGWRITKEPFMQRQRIFDDLKLRAGYGVTGNQPSAGFLGVALLGYSNYILYNGSWIQSLVPSQNPNPNLRWEEKHETDLGLDYSLLKGLITGTIDLYDRKIKGLLYNYAVPSPPNLYPSTQANVGTMENKGLEVLININPIRTKNVQWVTSFNFSTNSNRLISLSNELYQTTSNYFTTGYTSDPIQTFTNIVTIGQKIGDFYGFKVTGVSSDGQWIYQDHTGKLVPYASFTHAFEDKQVLGNGVPKYYAGWNNTVQLKNWDFSVTMRGDFGYQIANFQRMYYENPGIQNYNRLKSAYNKVFGTAVLSNSMPLEFNSYYIENGDFWKIDNINVGYNFRNLKSKYFHSLRAYVSTLNTFTITGYKGIDPEVNNSGLAPGIDNRDTYPTTRTYTLGISATF